MSESKQQIQDSKIGGKVNQTSDAAKADQKAVKIQATHLQQKISSQQDSLTLGKYGAKGLYAVIGLVIIAVLYLVVRFLISK
jgi:hypothetical protein